LLIFAGIAALVCLFALILYLFAVSREMQLPDLEDNENLKRIG
jgi:hypothetical protein